MHYRTSLLSLALLSLLPSLPAQAVPAPQDVLDAFGLHAATLQALVIPTPPPPVLRVGVEIDGNPLLLELLPYDVRSADFQLLVDDGQTLQRVPTPPSVTWRGQVVGRESAVAASVRHGQLHALLRLGEKTYAVEPVDQRVPAWPAPVHVVYRSDALRAVDARCGATGQPVPIGGGGGVGPAALKVAEVACDADFEFYQRHNSSVTEVQDTITTILNGVDLIYERDVEIQMQITTILVRTTAIYTSADINALLTEFRNRWNANHTSIRRDYAHLFDGKGSFAGVIGISYLGVVCSGNSAYGVSKAFSGLTQNVGLVAHEMGHNWNAGHCDATPPCNIMCSGLGGCSGDIGSFGSVSSATIIAYKNTRTCLSDPVAGPPVLTSLSPATVPAYNNGSITINGQRLNAVTRVSVGGVDSPAIGSTSSLQMHFAVPPTLPIATHTVQAFNAQGASNTLPFTITGNHPGVMVVPLFLLRGLAMPIQLHTDANWIGVLFCSSIHLPSVVPGVINLDIGANFNLLLQIGVMAANSSGAATLPVPIPTDLPTGLFLYFQAATLDLSSQLTLPIEVSTVGAGGVTG